MATLWIIDGYNFIRQSRRFSGLEAERGEKGKAAALRWLGRFSERTGELAARLSTADLLRRSAALTELRDHLGRTVNEQLAIECGFLKAFGN